MPVPQQAPMDPQTIAAMRHLSQLSRERERQRLALREPDQMTEADRAKLAELSQLPCFHCGGHHQRACPRVKLMTFHPNGNMASVEYFAARQIDWKGVVFEDDDQPHTDGPDPG